MLLLSHLTYRCTDDSQKQSNIAAGYYGKYEKWGQCPQESGGILDTSVFSKDTLRIFFSHWGFLFASIVHTWVAGDRSKGSFNQEAQKGTGNSTEVFSISQLEWAEWLAQMLHTGANLCLSWEPWKLDFLCRGGGGNAEQWAVLAVLSSTPPEHRGASSWNLQSRRSTWRLNLKITMTTWVRRERREAAWNNQVCGCPLPRLPPWCCEQNACQEQMKRGRAYLDSWTQRTQSMEVRQHDGAQGLWSNSFLIAQQIMRPQRGQNAWNWALLHTYMQ